jgi:hypothetical protein
MCVCASLTAKVLVISREDFLKRLFNFDTWQMVIDNHKAEKLWRK